MTLNVSPSDLSAFASLLGRAGDDDAEIKAYLEKAEKVAWYDHGLITKFAYSHRGVVETVEAVFDRYAKVVRESRAGMDQAARYYRETEERNARRMDELQPEVKRPAPNFKD